MNPTGPKVYDDGRRPPFPMSGGRKKKSQPARGCAAPPTPSENRLDRGCGQSLGSAPRGEPGGGFPHHRAEVSSPRGGQPQVPDPASQTPPSDRSAGPRCSLRAVFLGLRRLPEAYSWGVGARQATRSISAPSARTVLPVSARPALWAPFSSGGGRGNPQQLGRPWMEVDEGQLTGYQLLTAMTGNRKRRRAFRPRALWARRRALFPGQRDEGEEERRA